LQKEADLEGFSALKQYKTLDKPAEYKVRAPWLIKLPRDSCWSLQKRIQASGFHSEKDLDETIKKLEKAIRRARNKDLGIEEEEEKVWNARSSFQ
jgi:actin-related protein 5